MSEQPKPMLIKAKIMVEVELDPEVSEVFRTLVRAVRRTVSDSNVAAIVSAHMAPSAPPAPETTLDPIKTPIPEPAKAAPKLPSAPRRPARPVVADPKVPNVAPISAPSDIAAVILANSPEKVAEAPANTAVSAPPAASQIKTINDVSTVKKRAIHSYWNIGKSKLSIARAMNIDIEIVKQILDQRCP